MSDDVFVEKELLTLEQYRERYGCHADLESSNPKIGLMLLPWDVWMAVVSVHDLGFETQVSVDAVRWKAHGWDCMYRSLPVTKKYEQIFHTGFSGRDSRNRRYSGGHKRLDQLMTDVRHYSAIDAQLNEQGRAIHPDHSKGEMVVSLHRVMPNGMCDGRLVDKPGGLTYGTGQIMMLIDDQWHSVFYNRSMHKVKMALKDALDLLDLEEGGE